jgi:hypothetical protein
MCSGNWGDCTAVGRTLAPHKGTESTTRKNVHCPATVPKSRSPRAEWSQRQLPSFWEGFPKSMSEMAMLRQLMRPPAGAENTTFTIGITYAHLELPGLTEAVEKQDWETAKQQAEILRQALVNNNRLIVELKSSLSPEK